jgi:hypothetical protein
VRCDLAGRVSRAGNDGALKRQHEHHAAILRTAAAAATQGFMMKTREQARLAMMNILNL